MRNGRIAMHSTSTHSNREAPTGSTPTDPTRADPTRMANQPALQTSSGRVWLIMGALFMAVSLIPLVALAFVRQGPSAPLAIVIGAGVIGLYIAMVGARLAIKHGPVRLRILATLMLAMAGLALFGLIACSYLERQAVLDVALLF